MTKLQAIRKFADTIADEHVVIAQTRFMNGNWGMDIENSYPRLILPDNFDYHDETDDAFRKSFTERCQLADEFIDATLAIIHEFGHWFTRSVMDVEIYNKFVASNEDYFSNPYEMLATQWAICWLLNTTNRQIAKDFENNYLGRA